MAFNGAERHVSAGVSGEPLTFVATYGLGTQPDAGDEKFAGRIESIAQRLRLHEDPLKRSAEAARCCFFAGRNKTGIGNDSIELKHLLAIFCPAIGPDEKEMSLSFEVKEELLAKTQSLFVGLDLISLLDAQNFESEGLELVASLLPEFSRQDVAPADKIAFAIEHFRALLTRHMIGRHGGEVTPKLFYIATTFERNEKEKFIPRLEVYPHIYRQDYTEVSFFVTHHKIPSVTKFLIYRYLNSPHHEIVATTSAFKELDGEEGESERNQPVEICETFSQLFSEEVLGTASLTALKDKMGQSDQSDFLHIAQLLGCDRGDLTPWQVLQKSADPESRSIAAFVVEGRIVGAVNADGTKARRCLPRGIFAIESQYEDGFSDDDIKSLRIVFQGIASLIRMISHQHAPIDYRTPIAETFQEDVSPIFFSERKTKVIKLLFLVQKLDARLLHEFLEKCEKNLEAYHLDEQALKVLMQIKEVCPGNEKPSPEERAEILSARMKAMQGLLEDGSPAEADRFLSEKVMTFLEACPENFTWASYLACMAQTLGDRMDAGSTPPRFSRMMPGFSASGMFMAMVDGELRQVVKLSSAAKLRNEDRLYRKWVRYRLVNAARIPSNGFAFETTGERGLRSGLAQSKMITASIGEEMSDGVLVSDLVSGSPSDGEKVRTLLDVVAKCLVLTRKSAADGFWPDQIRIIRQIEAVFGQNALLWNNVPKEEREHLSPDQNRAVFNSFRIPEDPDSPAGIHFNEALSRLGDFSTTANDDLNFKKFFNLFRGKKRILGKGDLKEHWAITHGDLNARNLTWAEGLQSFFLIDFEHVGLRLKGSDQMRLAINLLTEMPQGFESTGAIKSAGKKSAAYTKIGTEVSAGMAFLGFVFKGLVESSDDEDTTLEAIVSNAADKPGVRGKRLVAILEAILATIDKRKLSSSSWHWHWAFMLYCAAIKEFSYTCKLTSREDTQGIMDATGKKSLLQVNIGELWDSIKKRLNGKPGFQAMKFFYLRHFVAAQLVLQLRVYLLEQEDDG